MIEREIKKKEEYEKKLKEGILKRYYVTISFSGDTEVFVTAGSIREAKEIAEEEMEMINVDIEIDSVSAYEAN